MSLKQPLEKLCHLLNKSGFLKTGNNNAVTGHGPAGTLLRQNISNTWWEKMVVNSEGTFPVSGSKDPLREFFPDLLQQMNRNVPFSMVSVSDNKPQQPAAPSQTHVLLNQSTETRLQFMHFCSPTIVNQIFDQVVHKRIGWWKQHCCKSSNFTQKNVTDDNVLQGLHIQYLFPWGPITIETIYKKGQEQFAKIEQETGSDCKFGSGTKTGYPCYIESSTSVDMATAVFLTDAFTEAQSIDETETRQVLQLHPALAPFKVAVTRDGDKQEQIHEVATYIARELRKAGLQILDIKDTESSAQSQISRHDELGIPFTVIINDNTIETGTVDLRNRDTTIHEVIAINKITDYIKRHVTYRTTIMMEVSPDNVMPA